MPAVNGHGDTGTGIPVPNHRVSETVAPTPTNPSAPRHTMQMSAAPIAPAPIGAPTGTGEAPTNLLHTNRSCWGSNISHFALGLLRPTHRGHYMWPRN